MQQGNHEPFMRRAIALGRKAALEDRIGGPFGAVVVRDGEIVGEGHARIAVETDPTWHAEMAAIRDAARRLGTHDLSGCIMYTSCECCAMCHAACWRAKIARIYYSATVEDLQTYGRPGDTRPRGNFVLPQPERWMPVEQIMHDEMVEVWRAFQQQGDKMP
jgi:guanine deaminase